MPAPLVRNNRIEAASTKRCTAFTVLGDGPGTRYQAESHLELCHLWLLNADRGVASFQDHVRFRYGDADEYLHEFDVVVTRTSGHRIAYTIKPEAKLECDGFLGKMQVIAGWVKRKKFADKTQLLTDADIDPVDLHNAKIFAAVRQRDCDAEAVTRGIVASLQGAATLTDLTRAIGLEDRGYRALLSLLRRGELRLARRERITAQSLVYQERLQ